MKKIKESISAWWEKAKNAIITMLGGVPAKENDKLKSQNKDLAELAKEAKNDYFELTHNVNEHLDVVCVSVPWTEAQHWLAKKRGGIPPIPEDVKRILISEIAEKIASDVEIWTDPIRHINTAMYIAWDAHSYDEPVQAALTKGAGKDGR